MARLTEVTLDNYKEVVELCVSPEQERWVGTTAEAIADAHFHPTYVMRAVTAAEGGEIVGFLMYERFGSWRTGDARAILYRFLIDCKHQGKGYGESALRRWLRLLNEPHGGLSPGSVEVHVKRENVAATALYRKLGFRVVFPETQQPLDI